MFAVLWRRKRLMMIPVIVLLLLAGIYLATEQKRYTSVARIHVSSGRPNSDGSDSTQPANFINAQAEKILSNQVLTLALAQPLPSDPDLPEKGRQKKIRQLSTFSSRDSDLSPLGVLREFAQVTVGRKDDSLAIGFESPYPEEAPMIANAIVDAFKAYQKEPRNTAVQITLAALENQKAEKVADLKVITDQIKPLAGAPQDSEDAWHQLALCEQSLAVAKGDVVKANRDYLDAKSMDPHPDAPMDDALLGIDEQTLRANLAQLKDQIRRMAMSYGERHPNLLSLHKLKDQAGVAFARAVKRRLDAVEKIARDQELVYEKQRKEVDRYRRQSRELASLRADAERLDRIIAPIETQINAIKIQQAAPLVDIDAWDPADPARTVKSHPSKARTLGLALAIGLLLGCGLALVCDRRDDRLYSSEEIRSSLVKPLLGAVPQMLGAFSAADTGQRVLMEPEGEVSEAFRSIRTAIAFGAPKDRSRTLLITSPTAGDGKSTAASNLAIVTAQAGKKVLLIDADLRNPRLNMIFSLGDVRAGLSSLLTGHGTWNQAIQRSPVEGLDLLPCGIRPPNASEMLNSPMFSELLENLAEKYDQIIIDSPPVMGLADARIVAASCDVTVLVLRAGKSTRKLSILAMEGLAGVGANVIGIIVNDVSRRDGVAFEGTYGYPQVAREPEAPAGAAAPVIPAAPHDTAEPPANDGRGHALARRLSEDSPENEGKSELPRPKRTAKRRGTSAGPYE
jgi:capsular exopolysaccharide synthesis family protein